jgi:DNA polymerase III delta subunit
MKVLHGEDQISSRRQLIALKTESRKKGNQLVELDGQNLTLTDLLNAVGTGSLFGGEVQVYIDQFFSRRPGKEKDQIVEYLKSQKDLGLVIWEGKDVSDQLKTFTPAISVRFDLPKYVFQFLDSLTLPLFQKALDSAAPEQIMALIVRQMHNLLLVKEGAASLPSWQLSKLQPLAQKFSSAKLKQSYRDLLDIDYRAKTSGSVMDLAANLQLWIVRLHVPNQKV